MFKMRQVRRVVQVIFFLFFLYLFVLTAYPLKSRLPVDLFLRIDPLIALATLIAGAKTSLFPSLGFIVKYTSQTAKELALFTLPLFILTLLLGRVFCGWICPLGTTIDIVDRILFWKRKRVLEFGARKDEVPARPWKLRNTKYYILILIFSTALFGPQIIYFFDPISLITRTFTLSFFGPVKVILRGSGEIIPPIASKMARIAPSFFRLNWLVFLIFSGIIAANLLSRRFWCRNLCPLGALLGIFSKFSFVKLFASEKCTRCMRCLRECKMGAICPEEPREHHGLECILCYTCVNICPPEAISIRTLARAPGRKTQLELSRRRLLQSFGLGIAWVAIAKTDTGIKRAADTEIKVSSPFLIRPPGAMPEDEFVANCVRCGECMKACPTNGLQPAFLEAGLEGFWTPILISRIGYCALECTLCGQVCPTNAIHPFTKSEKYYLFIGRAIINRSKCIVWAYEKTCLVCDENCNYDAIYWKVVEGFRRPFVNERRCVGCGQCEFACPVVPEAAIRVYSYGDQRDKSREEQRQFSGRPTARKRYRQRYRRGWRGFGKGIQR